MRISYFLYNGEYFIKNIADDYCDDLILDLCSELDGRLVIGTKVLDIIRGECKISEGSIPDGEQKSFAVIDEKCIPMEHFKKEGRVITAGMLKDTTVRSLIMDYAKTEKKVEELSSTLFEISEKVMHATIF